MVEKEDELRDRALEIDIVFPQGIVRIYKQCLGLQAPTRRWGALIAMTC